MENQEEERGRVSMGKRLGLRDTDLKPTLQSRYLQVQLVQLVLSIYDMCTEDLLQVSLASILGAA